jgi:hypothetical protein
MWMSRDRIRHPAMVHARRIGAKGTNAIDPLDARRGQGLHELISY